MLVVMDRTATGEDVDRVVAAVERMGLRAHPIPGEQRTAIGITGTPAWIAIWKAPFLNGPGIGV